MHLMGRSLGTLLVEQTSLARPGMDFAPQSFVIDSAKSVVHRKTAGEEKRENNRGHQLIFSKACCITLWGDVMVRDGRNEYCVNGLQCLVKVRCYHSLVSLYYCISLRSVF